MVEQALTKSTLCERYDHVLAKISSAASRSNRAVEEITLIVITKTHPPSLLREALELGMTDFGESRVQEAEGKIAKVGRQAVRWHLVGHLQANKARRAVHLFDVIHSLDSTSLARRLERLCEETTRQKLPVLIQIDLAGEETKSGIPEAEVEELAETINGCSRLELTGLMTLPPFFEEAERARPYFRRLRELRDDLKSKGYFGSSSGELSMGMSNDYEIAIEEGATMLRIGTAILGEREPLN
jgi:pyridoxal phosphate enzyme (YggS family)